MPIFKIKETELITQINIYDVEAESEKDALNKYCDELAGSIEPEEYYQDSTDIIEVNNL